jgi:hypothetical protein
VADTHGNILTRAKNSTIDFNVLLKGANLLVAGLVVFTFSRMHDNEFVDRETIILAILLCIQTQLALVFERRRRDPFVILLAFDMIFFFALRIVTLTIYPFSTVFDRFTFGARDSNYALIFILAANSFLYIGLYIGGSVKSQRIESVDWRARSPVRVLSLMVAAIIFAYFGEYYWNQDTIPRALGVLVLFLAPSITILMALSYYVLFRRSLTTKIAIAIAALIAADAAIHTLLGSRGAILVIVQNLIVVSLATMGCIKINRKFVLMGVVLLPAMAALLIATFVVSTYNRSAKDAGTTLDIGRAIELTSESGSELLVGADLDLLLPPIAARAGYFDYSAEIIAHRDEYASVLNVSTYAKSIVDNLLTPGFDVFDQPKISNALRFVYQGLGQPSKEWVTAENYQSDQLGIYGEFYGVFGYACLPILLITAFAFKRVYVSLKNRNPFDFAMKRAIVLFAFVWTVDSYGVDWTILEALPLVVAMFIYRPLFSSEHVPVAQIEYAQPRPPLDGPSRLVGE